MDPNALADGLLRGSKRAVLHLLKAGVEVLRGVEGFFEELSSATTETDEPDDSGPTRVEVQVHVSEQRIDRGFVMECYSEKLHRHDDSLGG